MNKILIVDDDQALSNSLRQILTNEGYEADVAFSGEEALHNMKKKNYDLLLLDIMLPGISGFDVLRTMRESGNKTCVVLITGIKEFQVCIDALDLDIYEILLKPLAPQEIIRATREAINEKKRYCELILPKG